MYVSDYRKLDNQTIKKVYNSYYKVINDLDINQSFRLVFTGILYENENNVFALKIYNPFNVVDNRLLYKPIELVRIGKNKKTSIPFSVTDSTSKLKFNVIDPNVYSEEIVNILISDVVIVDPNIMTY
jgi:hypothetical protein